MNGPARYRISDPLPFAPDLRDALLQHAHRTSEAVFEADAGPAIEKLLEQWRDGSELWVPETGEAISAPVEFAGQLQLVGYKLDADQAKAGDEIGLTVLWRVSGDVRPPVSAFVHLLAADGSALSQYDGWETAIRGLEVGDVIVHRVRLTVPHSVDPGLYRLQIGLYSPNTMARWEATTPAGDTFDRLWLPVVEVL
jgi:hypothetical protein